MKLLFTVDNYFYQHGDGVIYSKGLYPYSIWERYLAVFDEIIVAARIIAVHDCDENELAKMNVSSGPKVTFISVPSLGGAMKRLKNMRIAKESLLAALHECDCMIARIPSVISSMAIKLVNEVQKPLAVEVVSCPWDTYWNHGSLEGKLYAPFATLRTKTETKQAKYALYVTESFLQKRYPCDGVTVPCSDVVIQDVSTQTLDNRLLPLRLNRQPIKIGFIGYLGTRIKGLDTALAALSIVNKKMSSFEFHILGGGDITPWQKLAEEYGLEKKTTFYGSIPAGEPVFTWIDDIDLYIHPSRQEGLSRAVVEVMSRGCPVIASDVGGNPELISNQFTHKPNDSRQLAELIQYVINNQSVRVTMAKDNFEKAQQYSKSKLDKKRKEFLHSFREYCEKGMLVK